MTADMVSSVNGPLLCCSIDDNNIFTITMDEHEYAISTAHLDVTSPDFEAEVLNEFEERYQGDIIPRDHLLVHILRMKQEKLNKSTASAANTPTNRLTWRDVVSVVGSPSPQFTTSRVVAQEPPTIIFPLSLVVEDRIISSVHQHILEEGNDFFQSIFGENVAHEKKQLTLLCVREAIQAVAVEMFGRDVKGPGQPDARLALDDYLEKCLVPLLHEKGLLPLAVIAVDTAMYSIRGSTSIHFCLKRYEDAVHQWFVTATRITASSSSMVQHRTTTTSSSSSPEKLTIQTTPSNTSLSLRYQSTADKSPESHAGVNGRQAKMFIAPLHSPTKFTTGVFSDDK